MKCGRSFEVKTEAAVQMFLNRRSKVFRYETPAHFPGRTRGQPEFQQSLADFKWVYTGARWCRGAELNCLRRPFQGRALPVSYLGTGVLKRL